MICALPSLSCPCHYDPAPLYLSSGSRDWKGSLTSSKLLARPYPLAELHSLDDLHPLAELHSLEDLHPLAPEQMYHLRKASA